MLVVEVILSLIAAYLGCGALFGVAFVTVGVARVDAAARQSSWLFRLLIYPGSVALWPYLAARWLHAPRQEGHA
jgi:hypothetical protein